MNIENITELNNILETFKTFKTDMKAAMLEKTGEEVGNDITTYPEKVKEIETGGTIVIDGGHTKCLLCHPVSFKMNYDIKNCTLGQIIYYLSDVVSEDETIEPIIIDFRKNSYDTSVQLFYIDNTTVRSNFHNQGIKRYFTLRNIPKSNLGTLFKYFNVNDSKIKVEFDDDYLENNNFDLTNMFANLGYNITEIPEFFYKILPYATSLRQINYMSTGSDTTKFQLDGQDITFELAKKKEIDLNYSYSNFNYFTANTLNIILHNNLKVLNSNGLFGANSVIKNLNITGGDNNGFYIPTKSNAVLISSACSVENLKIHLKSSVNFSLANITNTVELLPGSEFASISNLPYVTQEGWVEFFNSLPDVSSSTLANKINIAANYYALLSEDDKLIAVDKGYTLASV